MTTYIYDKKVISSRREGFGMIIESEEFAKMQEHLFSVLWAASDLDRPPVDARRETSSVESGHEPRGRRQPARLR